MVGDNGQIFLRDDFTNQSGDTISGNQYSGGPWTYYLGGGSGSRSGIAGTVAGFVGGWQLTSGASATNNIFLGQYYSASNGIPAPSATSWTYDAAIKLTTIANDYHAVGVTQAGNTVMTASGSAIWCDVTDTGSAGAWACHMQNYSGGLVITNIAISPAPTASTNVLIWRFIATTTEIDIYTVSAGTSTKLGCTNVGGTGGCTAWTANSLPGSGPMGTQFETKNNASVAASMDVLAWSFLQ
jgi:hypothetical protein